MYVCLCVCAWVSLTKLTPHICCTNTTGLSLTYSSIYQVYHNDTVLIGHFICILVPSPRRIRFKELGTNKLHVSWKEPKGDFDSYIFIYVTKPGKMHDDLLFSEPLICLREPSEWDVQDGTPLRSGRTLWDILYVDMCFLTTLSKAETRTHIFSVRPRKGLFISYFP